MTETKSARGVRLARERVVRAAKRWAKVCWADRIAAEIALRRRAWDLSQAEKALAAERRAERRKK